MGRLQIILSTHFGSSAMTLGEGVEFDGTFLGLFERFSFKNFPVYWHFVTWGGLACGFYLLKKSPLYNKVQYLLIIVISFLLIQTFAVKSLFPFIPMEDFIVRYFMPILPLVLLPLSAFILEILPFTLKINEPLLFSIPIVLLLFLGIFIDRLPQGVQKYINNPLQPKENQFYQTIMFNKKIDKAFMDGTTFYTYTIDSTSTENKRNSAKALDSVNRLYLDLDNNKGMYNTEHKTLKNGSEIELLGVGSSRTIRVFREPFELLEVESIE